MRGDQDFWSCLIKACREHIDDLLQNSSCLFQDLMFAKPYLGVELVHELAHHSSDKKDCWYCDNKS